MIEKLLCRNLDYVILDIFSYLDFLSLRNCLWTCTTWRKFILENWSRLCFDEKELEHNVSTGNLSKKEVLFWPFWFERDTSRNRVVEWTKEEEELFRLSQCYDMDRLIDGPHLMNDNYLMFFSREGMVKVCRSTGDANDLEPPWWHPCSDRRLNPFLFRHSYRDYLFVQAQDFVRTFKLSPDAKEFLVWHEDYLTSKDIGRLDEEPINCLNQDYDAFWANSVLFTGCNQSGSDFRLYLTKMSRKFMLHLTDLTNGETLWKDEFVSGSNAQLSFKSAVEFGNDFLVLAHCFNSNLPSCPEAGIIYVRTYKLHSGKLLSAQKLQKQTDTVPSELSLSSWNHGVLLTPPTWKFKPFVSCYLLDLKASKCDQKSLDHFEFHKMNPNFAKMLRSIKLCSRKHVVTCLTSNDPKEDMVLFAIFKIGIKTDATLVKWIIYPNADFRHEVKLLKGYAWMIEVQEHEQRLLKPEEETKTFLLLNFDRSLKDILPV